MRLIPGVVAFLCAASACAAGEVLLSPCDESGEGPKQRREAKIDREQPPADSAQIQPITPAEMCAWKAPGDKAPRNGRRDSEQKWYALTGRIVRQTRIQMFRCA